MAWVFKDTQNERVAEEKGLLRQVVELHHRWVDAMPYEIY
jgi:hypothetical protein